MSQFTPKTEPMKSIKLFVLLSVVALSLNSCLSMKLAENITAKEEYPGEYFKDDTFKVTVNNLDDKKTKIRVVDKVTKEESIKMEIAPTSQVELLVKGTDIVLISKSAKVEYKFELTGE